MWLNVHGYFLFFPSNCLLVNFPGFVKDLENSFHVLFFQKLRGFYKYNKAFGGGEAFLSVLVLICPQEG